LIHQRRRTPIIIIIIIIIIIVGKHEVKELQSTATLGTAQREFGERRERIPTRCNNIDVYCQFRCLILTTVSTCFGHLYAHHQEKKDHVLLHMGLFAGSAGCGWLRYCGATF